MPNLNSTSCTSVLHPGAWRLVQPPNLQATQTLDKLIKMVPQYQAYISFTDTDVVALADW